MSLPRLATDTQLDELYDAALRTLDKAGFLYQDAELVQYLTKLGCREEADGRVHIPRAVVEEMLAPRRAAAEVPPDGPPRRTGEIRPQISVQIAQFYLDHESGQRVPGDRDLLAELAKFGHVWQPGAPVGPVLLLRDVPPMVEPMEAVVTLCENTDRVFNAYVHYAEQIPYLSEMGRILTGDHRSFIGICVFTVTPLRLDLRACRLLVELTRQGAPVWLGTQPAAGASSPVTVPGTVVLAVAEILAGWVASFAVSPELMPGAGICSGVLDMRTADVSYCAPEATLQDLLCIELCRERLGGRCGAAGGAGYTDAKWPGSQKAFETAFEALTIYTYTGQGPGAGQGLLESGKTFSPVQFMLDDDFGQYMQRFACGVDYGPGALALDEILQVGTGIGASHLATEHTLVNFRSLFEPALLDRSCWKGDEREAKGEAALLDRAWQRFRDVRAHYQPAAVDDERLAAVRRVVADARRDLCGLGSD